MPPQRRKYNAVDSFDDDTKSSKRLRNMNSDLKYNSRRGSKSYEATESSCFSQKRCLLFFKEFACTILCLFFSDIYNFTPTAPNDPENIDPEGIERLCNSIRVAPEDIVMLVLSWKMEAKQMGYYSVREWLKGLSELQCDTITKLRSKLDYLRSLLNDAQCFRAIYRYAFDFAKDKDQRNIDIETAKAMLHLLLSKKWVLYSSFHEFLEQSKYKVLNKDQWCNVLEFSRSVSCDLKNYDEDGAWPVLLDEFVEWHRKFKMSY